MNIILDMFGFTKKLEGILNDTMYLEIPTSRVIRGYTQNENDNYFKFWKFKKTNEMVGNYVIFKLMESIDYNKVVNPQWTGGNTNDTIEPTRFFVAAQYSTKKEKPTSYGYA